MCERKTSTRGCCGSSVYLIEIGRQSSELSVADRDDKRGFSVGFGCVFGCFQEKTYPALPRVLGFYRGRYIENRQLRTV